MQWIQVVADVLSRRSSEANKYLRKQDRVLAEQIPLFDAGQDEAGMESIIVAPAPEDGMTTLECGTSQIIIEHCLREMLCILCDTLQFRLTVCPPMSLG